MEEIVQPGGPEDVPETEPVVTDPKPKRQRATRARGPVPVPPKPAEAKPDEGDELEAVEELEPVPLPTRKFLCSIPKAKDKALEEKREVEALTAADAREKYMAEMGIVKIEGDLKVVAEEV